MPGSIWNPSSAAHVGNADATLKMQSFTASDGDTFFDLTAFTYVVGLQALIVFRDGVFLERDVDFLENTSSRFNLVTPATVGEKYIAVGFVGISGIVSDVVLDLFTVSHAALRIYSGAATTRYVLGAITPLDGKEGWYQYFIDGGPGTYVDDGDYTILPQGGDGSTAWRKTSASDNRSQAGLETVSQTEAEQGTLEIPRAWTALRVAQSIAWKIIDLVTGPGTKLDGIEVGATTDQTNAEIRAAVAAATDSNVFSDAEKTDVARISTDLGATNVKLNTKVIDIGDWNMDADTIASVAHGVTETDIRSVSVLIRNDTDSVLSNLETQSSFVAGSIQIFSGDVVLRRQTSGPYDSTNYDSTAFNRGWITIQYTD